MLQYHKTMQKMVIFDVTKENKRTDHKFLIINIDY